MEENEDVIKEDNMESFGTRLANIRRKHNLTQNDIADGKTVRSSDYG